MKNICLIIPKGLPLPDVKGGAIETLVTDIININEKENKVNLTVVSIYDSMAEEISKKYKNTNFLFIRNNLTYKITAIKVRIKNLFGKNLNTYNEAVFNKIKKKKFDKIVVEDGAYMSFTSYLRKYKKEDLILHMHHVGETNEGAEDTFGSFIGISQFVADNFMKKSNIKKSFVLKNGVDLAKFKNKMNKSEIIELRKEIGFDKNDFIVIYCGRLVKEKGVLELIKAVKSIKEEKIKLLIIGSLNFAIDKKDEYHLMLEEEVKGFEEKIKFTGYIKNKEVYKYYKTADICVIPSIWEEGAALVNIEAMACGLPLIVTNSGGIPEYATKKSIFINNGKNIINDIKENIIYLYNDKDKRIMMSKDGVIFSENFSSNQFYKNFIKIIEEDGNNGKK